MRQKGTQAGSGRAMRRVTVAVQRRPAGKLAAMAALAVLSLSAATGAAYAQGADATSPGDAVSNQTDVAASAGAAAIAARDAGKIITSWGYSTYGDLKYPKDFKHFDYVNPNAPKGGEISVWAQGTFDNFNPFTRKGVAGSLSSIGYETILTPAADEVSSQYCLLCETLEYPQSRAWVIFHLRHNVKFSDGTPMTAADVVFSFNLLMKEALPSYSAVVSRLIAKAEAMDPYTVKFTFQPDAPRKDLVSEAGGIPVFEKAWYEKTGAHLNEPQMKISPGTGPYMLDSYKTNERIIYKRNPDYWGRDLPVNVGRWNFDRIRVEYFADSDAAFEAFKSGVYTFRQENSSLSWATKYHFPALQNGYVVKETPRNGNLPPAYGMVFNLRREKFQDRRVRLALGLMFNFEWTNQTLQYGLFKHRDSFWQNSPDEQAQGVPKGRELDLLKGLGDKIDPSILTDPVFTSHSSDPRRQLDRHNFRKASQLLEQAGWKVGNDGMRRKNGKTLDVEFLSSSPNFDRVITPYVENLKQLGVNARYNRIDTAQYSQRVNAGDFDFDMIYDGYSTSLEAGNGMKQQFGSQGVGDLFNPAGFSSPAVDALIDDAVRADNREDMAAAVRGIDRIMRHDYYMVPSWYLDTYWLAYYDMYRHPDPLPPYALGQLDFWWYDAAKAAKLKAAGAIR